MGQSEVIMIAVLLMGGVLMLVLTAAMLNFLSLWIQALASGAPVSLPMMIFMKMRKVPPRIIVYARINAVKGGVPIGIHELEAHYLAGGDVPRTVAASIAASKAGIPLSFGQASAIDLAGRDVLAIVKEQVMQKEYNAGAIEDPSLVGQAGIVSTTFRPAGTIVVNGRRYEAVSDGDCMAEGEAVSVVGWESGWAVVARYEV